MKYIKTGVALVGLFAAGTSQAQAGIPGPGAADKIFETNITRDLATSSGEPEIAVNPANPRHLAIIEFAVGSAKVPASSGKALSSGNPEAMIHNGRVMLSADGGNSWTIGPNPVSDPGKAFGADPAIAYGPDGTLYVVNVLGPKPGAAKGLDSDYTPAIAMSRDGGKTFNKTELLPTAPHRPWLEVDNKTGTVYVSTIGFPPSVADSKDLSKSDGWVIAFKPHLTAHSEPRRTGGDGYIGRGGHHLTAANGVVATTFMLGGSLAAARTASKSMPVPSSLTGLIKDGTTTCTPELPCLFFQTSTDEARHWTVHHVPMPKTGYSGIYPLLAADPGRPGRYAISFMSRDAMIQTIVVTDDSGKTWTQPIQIPETLQGKVSKPWMEYAPNGVLGLMWKKERPDLPTVPTRPLEGSDIQRAGLAFDVYTAISCDGGKTWLPPVRVNTETSPAGLSGLDDMSYMAMDAHFAHVVWSDRRHLPEVKNEPNGIGGPQVYYARVPFSTASKGAKCGR